MAAMEFKLGQSQDTHATVAHWWHWDSMGHGLLWAKWAQLDREAARSSLGTTLCSYFGYSSEPQPVSFPQQTAKVSKAFWAERCSLQIPVSQS